MAIIVILGNMISNSQTRLQEEFGGVKRGSSGSSTRNGQRMVVLFSTILLVFYEVGFL